MNYIIVMANRLDKNIVSLQELKVLSSNQSNESDFSIIVY